MKKKLNIFNSRNFYQPLFSISYTFFITQNINTHTFITVLINLAILAINFFHYLAATIFPISL